MVLPPDIADSATVKCTVLCVEDNLANMALVKQLIERRSDLILLTAITADTSIQMAQEYCPAVIIMDINLPDINGFIALEILRANPTSTHIPVIALSSDAYPNQIEKGIKAGFFRYITKPFHIDEFMDALDAAIHYAKDFSREFRQH
jgi:CheY-like chemotaxis protein